MRDCAMLSLRDAHVYVQRSCFRELHDGYDVGKILRTYCVFEVVKDVLVFVEAAQDGVSMGGGVVVFHRIRVMDTVPSQESGGGKEAVVVEMCVGSEPFAVVGLVWSMPRVVAGSCG